MTDADIDLTEDGGVLIMFLPPSPLPMAILMWARLSISWIIDEDLVALLDDRDDNPNGVPAGDCLEHPSPSFDMSEREWYSRAGSFQGEPGPCRGLALQHLPKPAAPLRAPRTSFRVLKPRHGMIRCVSRLLDLHTRG